MTFGEAVSRELEDVVDGVNVEAGDAATTTPHARNGGPLCNRLKTHLIIYLVEDCIRFDSPVLLATEKNEQFNKNLRAIIMKTNKQNPSRDLAVINSREVMLRNIAMGCFWDNGTKTGGLKVKTWLERYGGMMFFNANREFGSAEYISGKKVAANMTAIFDLRYPGSTNVNRRFLGKVIQKRGQEVTVQEYQLVDKPLAERVDGGSLFKNCMVDDGGNLLARECYQPMLLQESSLDIIELLDMSQSTRINSVEHLLINRSKFGTLW
ncbi:hypothetical protein BD770DRAFT_405221, partial [Pilaira anomala]